VKIYVQYLTEQTLLFHVIIVFDRVPSIEPGHANHHT
jgi:hypothetical protein